MDSEKLDHNGIWTTADLVFSDHNQYTYHTCQNKNSERNKFSFSRYFLSEKASIS
ncbi:MAG: hypothetical protein V3U71_03435 [Cocleimonas sp.]